MCCWAYAEIVFTFLSHCGVNTQFCIILAATYMLQGYFIVVSSCSISVDKITVIEKD